jgi:arabinogalactan oligomer/maltooligosaccharide transport system substrate-binding protein
VFEQNADGSYTSDIAMGGENGEAYAQWLAEQGEAGTLSPDVTYDIAVEAFANGESPFIIGGPWMLEKFTDLDVTIDPIPAPGDQPAQPFVGVAGFYLSAQSENPLVANDFLVNFMSTQEAQTALYEAGGRPPALTAAADAVSSDRLVTGFRAVGKDAVPMPSIPAMDSVWAFWGVTEANILTGSAEPAEAWDKMITDIDGAIGS